MNLFDDLQKALQEYPALQLIRTEHQLRIDPPNPHGFRVLVEAAGSEWIVHLDQWWERFLSEEDAAECVLFAFSGQCRLRVASRGNAPYEWTLEYREGKKWRSDRTIRKPSYKLWQPRHVTYLHNIL